MYSKVVLSICAIYAIICMVSALPLGLSRSKSGKIYQLIPLQINSDKAFYNLQRTRRNVFPDFGQAQQETHSKTGHELVILEPTKKGDNKSLLVEEKKEELKTSADTIYPVVYRVRREYGSKRRYDDSDRSYEDSDSAGYDRKGSDVGYMDDSDDFPTVVW